MIRCPNCHKLHTTDLVATIIAKFTLYPTGVNTRNVDEIRQVFAITTNPQIKEQVLVKPYLKCRACGEGTTLGLTDIVWADTENLVTIAESQAKANVEDARGYYEQEVRPLIPPPHEEPKPKPYVAEERPYRGFTVILYDFETMNNRFAFSVRNSEGAIPFYGGRFKSASRALVAAMAVIDNVL